MPQYVISFDAGAMAHIPDEDMPGVGKTSRQWAATDPDLACLAGKFRQFSDEIERLRALLREHGIEPESGAA